MNNIRQITNFSNEVTSAPVRYVSIIIGDAKKYITAIYCVLPASVLTGSDSTPINKLGYVCEPRGIDYPIMITTGGVLRTIYLGKTGMFETMPEVFLNANDETAEELDCTPKITEVWLPIGERSNPIKFKFDYVFATN